MAVSFDACHMLVEPIDWFDPYDKYHNVLRVVGYLRQSDGCYEAWLEDGKGYVVDGGALLSFLTQVVETDIRRQVERDQRHEQYRDKALF